MRILEEALTPDLLTGPQSVAALPGGSRIVASLAPAARDAELLSGVDAKT
jgi:hypothetical protein